MSRVCAPNGRKKVAPSEPVSVSIARVSNLNVFSWHQAGFGGLDIIEANEMPDSRYRLL
jgi:hypothetical protein